MSGLDVCKPQETVVTVDPAGKEPNHEPSAVSNGDLASRQPAEPVDADPDGQDALATTLLGLLAADGPPAPPSLITAIVGCQSLPARSALYFDAEFWNRDVWRDGKLSATAVRQQVDPLGAVDNLADQGLAGPERASALRGLLVQLPQDRDRLARDFARRTALLAGLTAVDRHRVLHAIVAPTAPDIDAASLFIATIHAGDVAAARQAWAAASAAPGIAIRLARDADLMAQLRSLSAELAEQVRWELSSTLVSGQDASREAVFQAAARPALQAIGVAHPSDAALISATVHRYLEDVDARLASQCGDAEPDVTQSDALQWFANTYAVIRGRSLGQSLSVGGAWYQTDRERVLALFEGVDIGRGSGDLQLVDIAEDVERRLAEHSLHAAAELIQIAEAGAPLLAATLRLREEMRSIAEDADAEASTVERQVGTAMSAIGNQIRFLGRVPSELAATLGSRADQHQFLSAIGERKDAVAQAAEAQLQHSEQNQQSLPQPLIALAAQTGVDLATAANATQADACLSSATTFATELDAAISTGVLSAEYDDAFIPIIEAAFAPIGGSLRHSLSRMDNADVIFSYLGYHSVGAALRKSGDTRSDDVLSAEHIATDATTQLFEAIANAVPGTDQELTNAITATTSLVSVDETARTPMQALHDLYQHEFGIALATHVTRDLPSGPAQDALLTRIAAPSPGPVPEAIDRVHPDFFTIPGESSPRIAVEPTTVSDSAAIATMAQHHVDELVPITVSRLDASLLLRYIGSLRLRGNAYTVVCRAFEKQTSTTLAFHVHRAEARGELGSQSAESLRHSLQPGDLSPLAERVRTHAQARDWTGLLSVTEGAPAAARAELLADGETMVVLRDSIRDDQVWYATVDSLNGELDVSALLDQDTTLDSLLEFGGKVFLLKQRLLVGLHNGNVLESVWADPDASFDVSAILQARREGLTPDERAHDAATMSVDADVWSTLDRTVGEGQDRTDSEQAINAGGNREATDPTLDAQMLVSLGTGGQATSQASGTDSGFWQLDQMRDALIAMTPDERKAASVNPMMLDRLDRLTAGNPRASAELFGILQGGVGRAEADRINSTGSGVDWRTFQHPWEAVTALADLSANERALIALDSGSRDAWIQSAQADPAAQTQIQLLFDSATTAVSPTTLDGDSHPGSTSFIVQATAQLEAAAQDASDPQKAMLEAASAVASNARQANATDPNSDGLTAEGWSIDTAMSAVWQRNHLLIYNTLTTVLSGLNDAHFLAPVRSVPEANADAGVGLTTPGISKAQMAMAEATLADWRTPTVGYAALAMYRVSGQAEDQDAMKSALKQMNDTVFAAELTSLKRPSHTGDASLQSVYLRFETAWNRRTQADPNSPDSEALAASEESARRDLTTHPVGAAQDAALTMGSRLGGFWLGDQERILAVIHERLAQLPLSTIVSTVQADPQHAGLLWSPGRPLEARIRAGRDRADRLLGGVDLSSPTTWTGAITETDDIGRARFDALGRGYQKVLADGEVTEDEASGVRELEAELGVSLDEFIAAKKQMATIAVEIATTAIAAIAGALTAGTGAVAVGLIKVALSGAGQMAIEHALMGDDNTSGMTPQQLLGKLVMAGAGGMMGKVFERGSAAAVSALQSSRAQSLVHLAVTMQAASKSPLAEAGIAMVGGAVAPIGDDISAAAGKMLSPSEWAYGFDQAWRARVHEVGEAVDDWPDESIRGALTGLATHLADQATEEDPSSSGQQLTDLVVPDPIREPKAYREYLAKRLKKARSAVLSTLTEAAAEELVEQAYREGTELVMTGDVEIDVDALMAGLGSVARKTGKKALSEVTGAAAGAVADRRTAHARHAASQHHETRMALAEHYTESMQPHERAAFDAWSLGRAFPEDSAQHDAAVFADVQAFERSVLVPLRRTLHPIEDDEPLHRSYRDWVLSDPQKASERIRVEPWRFEIRRDAAAAELARQRDSQGYRALSEHQQRWYDHAATRPEHMADLTKSTPQVAVSIHSTEGAAAFGTVLAKREVELAGQTLDSLASGLSEDEQAFVQARRSDITAALRMDPVDATANERTVRQRIASLRAGQAIEDANPESVVD